LFLYVYVLLGLFIGFYFFYCTSADFNSFLYLSLSLKKTTACSGSILEEFNKIEKEFNSILFNINENNFKSFINGLHQAEGTLGVYFPKLNHSRFARCGVVYSFSIGQNYSPVCYSTRRVVKTNFGYVILN